MHHRHLQRSWWRGRGVYRNRVSSCLTPFQNCILKCSLKCTFPCTWKCNLKCLPQCNYRTNIHFQRRMMLQRMPMRILNNPRPRTSPKPPQTGSHLESVLNRVRTTKATTVKKAEMISTMPRGMLRKPMRQRQIIRNATRTRRRPRRRRQKPSYKRSRRRRRRWSRTTPRRQIRSKRKRRYSRKSETAK